MRYLIFLIFSISLISDEGDIVERKTLDTEIYKKDLKSFCRPKLKNNESTWFEDFDNPQLSRTDWNYSFSNGFYDGRTYISGWGNGELQYYTKPKKNNKNYVTRNLFIEDGLLKIQPIRKPYKGFKYTSSRSICRYYRVICKLFCKTISQKSQSKEYYCCRIQSKFRKA